MARTKNFTRYIMCFSLFILGLKQPGHAIFLGLQMLGEASGITGYNFSAQNNVVHPTVVQGAKTTTGGQCIIAEGTVLGDKCSVKRSVIGRHCRIGSNVKIVNSIVMNHVTIEDNCTIQGSVISSNVQIQERASLKDCQVGAGYVITAGREYKSEPLTKR